MTKIVTPNSLQASAESAGVEQLCRTMPEAASRGGSRYRLGLLLAACLSVVSVAPIWAAHYFPSQNGPEYLLLSWMYKQWDNPVYDYQKYYEFLSVLPPNITTQGIVYGLLSWCSPVIAWKIMLTMLVILLPISIFYFLAAVRPRDLTVGYCSFLFVPNYYLFKGYENFYLSIAMFLFCCGFLIWHRDRMNVRDTAILTLLVLATYFAHMFSFLVLLLVVPLLILLSDWNKRRAGRILLSLVPALILFTHYMYVVLTLSDRLVGGHDAWIRYPSLHASLVRYVEMTMYSLSMTPVALFLVPMSLIYGGALYAAWHFARSGKWRRLRLRRNDLGRQEQSLVLLIVLSVVFFAAPWEIAGWPKFNERFLPFVFVFLLGATTFPRSFWLRRAFVVAVIFCSVAINALFVREAIAADKLADEYLSGISIIDRNRKLLPVHIDETIVGRIRPLRWAFNYYNIERGGATRSSVVQYAGRVPMQYKGGRRSEAFPPFDPRHPEQANMSKIHDTYDYVLFWGRNESVFKQFRDNGFQMIYQRGRLTICKNRRPNRRPNRD